MLKTSEIVKLLKLGMPINEESLQKVNAKERLEEIDTQISKLKKALADEDYKIIKANECFLANRQIPYNIIDLNTKRDGIRSQIGELEIEKSTMC